MEGLRHTWPRTDVGLLLFKTSKMDRQFYGTFLWDQASCIIAVTALFAAFGF